MEILTQNQKTVAILYIATGRYTVFWDGFYHSAEQYLLADSPEYKKHFFVFTDCTKAITGEGINVAKIFQPKLGWPHDTLMRFDIFLGIKEQLEKFDYIYFFNGNTVFEAPIGPADLIPVLPEKLVFGLQPHIFLLPRREFTYETNPKSTAAIGDNEGVYYFMGGVNGGDSVAYLAMCAALSRNIHQDLNNNMVALWHDESHLNRYAIGREDIKILPPLFSRGETESWKQGSKLYFADKSHYRFGGHAYLRGESDIPLSREAWQTSQIHNKPKYLRKIKEGFRYRILKMLYFMSVNKPWKILYHGFIPKKKRLKLSQVQFDQMFQQSVSYFWKRKIQAYQMGEISHSSMRRAKQNQMPNKIIWQYWADGWDDVLLPPIVKLCQSSVDKFRGDYTVIRLDDTNLSEYLDIPDFVTNKRSNKNFGIAFYADLIRIMLLHTYGGVWLDATVLLTDRLPEKYTKPDLFMFQRSGAAKNKLDWMAFNPTYFNWAKNSRINSLNSIIFAQKGNQTLAVMQDLLLDFWQTQDTIPHYFFFQILFDEIQKSNYAPNPYPAVDDTLPHLLQISWHKSVKDVNLADLFYQNQIHKLTYVPLGKSGTVSNAVEEWIVANKPILD